MGVLFGYLLGRDSRRPQGQRSGCATALVLFIAFALMIGFITQYPYIAIPILVVVFGLGFWAKARERQQATVGTRQAAQGPRCPHCGTLTYGDNFCRSCGRSQ